MASLAHSNDEMVEALHFSTAPTEQPRTPNHTVTLGQNQIISSTGKRLNFIDMSGFHNCFSFLSLKQFIENKDPGIQSREHRKILTTNSFP